MPIEEAEARHTHNGVPFGLQNENWRKLKAMILADWTVQVWSFCSPPETWTGFPLCGMEGYAAVKDGKVIGFVLTALS